MAQGVDYARRTPTDFQSDISPTADWKSALVGRCVLVANSIVGVNRRYSADSNFETPTGRDSKSAGVCHLPDSTRLSAVNWPICHIGRVLGHISLHKISMCRRAFGCNLIILWWFYCPVDKISALLRWRLVTMIAVYLWCYFSGEKYGSID